MKSSCEEPFSLVICPLQFIRWPKENEMRTEATQRELQCRIPGIIGCIDCTHVVIDPPQRNKDDYIDRKGDRSVIVQAVCNNEKKFIDCFIVYPGSVHDSRVFRNSTLYDQLGILRAGYRLIGDSAYPCLIQLLTPYRDNGHITPAQHHYNYKLSSQRIDIEHSFGILKQRFRQLYYCKLRDMSLICHFIRACMVLHNMSDADDLNFTYQETAEDTNDPQNETTDGTLQSGILMRNATCQTLQAYLAEI